MFNRDRNEIITERKNLLQSLAFGAVFFVIATMLVASRASAEMSKLPPCPTDVTVIWNNCFGTLTTETGNKYVGEFKNNKMYGQGTYYFAGGDKYTGEFKDDKLDGLGTYISSKGEKYEGEFKNSEFNGRGTLTTMDGKAQSGLWNDGQLVQEEKLESVPISGVDVSYNTILDWIKDGLIVSLGLALVVMGLRAISKNKNRRPATSVNFYLFTSSLIVFSILSLLFMVLSLREANVPTLPIGRLVLALAFVWSAMSLFDGEARAKSIVTGMLIINLLGVMFFTALSYSDWTGSNYYIGGSEFWTFIINLVLLVYLSVALFIITSTKWFVIAWEDVRKLKEEKRANFLKELGQESEWRPGFGPKDKES